MSFRNTITILFVLGATSALLADNCHEEHADINSDAPKTTFVCPVGNQEADSSVYLDHEGKRYYFCCAGCRKPFKADPAKYSGASKPDNAQDKEGASQKTEQRYEVFGMDCPGCHGGVEKLVKKIVGVADARANYLKKEIVVVVEDASRVNDEEVFAAIRKANFTPGKRLE